jgi:non-heme chloroperoxidase
MTDRVMPELPSGTSDELHELPTGATLRVLRRGSGPMLVMAPGWTCTADFFAHQLDGLADRFTVVAYDPRGHGGSSKPLDGNTFRQRGADLAALLDILDEDQVHLFGWSFGVFDVLSYLRDHGTGRAATITLCYETPKCPADPANPDDWGEMPLTPDGIVAFFRLVIDDRLGFWSWYATYMIGVPEETTTDHPDVARIVELGMQTPQHIALATFADGATSDFAHVAAEVSEQRPTLFIAREDWSEDAERWVLANLPSAQFATMPLHMGFATHPNDFNASLRRFLDDAGA